MSSQRTAKAQSSLLMFGVLRLEVSRGRYELAHDFACGLRHCLEGANRQGVDLSPLNIDMRVNLQAHLLGLDS